MPFRWPKRGFLEKRLRGIARRLTNFDLQRPGPEDDATVDIEQYLFEKERTGARFLEFYSQQGLADALERYGTFERLRKRGFSPYLTFHRLDRERHMLTISDGEQGETLIELVGRLAFLKAKQTHDGIYSNDTLSMLAIEWLLLQNPRARFTTERPRLPGQRYPGLGIGREIVTLLEIMTERLEREGMVAIPEHYHNGFLYDRRFRFYSPEREGELKALERDLSALTLAEASWAVEKGLVIDEATGKPYQWKGEEMIWPRVARLKDYFDSDEYKRETERVATERHFRYDRDRITKVMKAILKEIQ